MKGALSDITTLKPFSFEPELSKEEQYKLVACSERAVEVKRVTAGKKLVVRIGNIDWYLCDQFKPMETLTCRKPTYVAGTQAMKFRTSSLKDMAFILTNLS